MADPRGHNGAVGTREVTDVVEERRRFFEQSLTTGLSVHEQAHLHTKAANDKQSDATTSTSSPRKVRASFRTSPWGHRCRQPCRDGRVRRQKPRLLLPGVCPVPERAGVRRRCTRPPSSPVVGGHERRANDWTLQRELATRELRQIDLQIAAARIRVALQRRNSRKPRQADRSTATRSSSRSTPTAGWSPPPWTSRGSSRTRPTCT